MRVFTHRSTLITIIMPSPPPVDSDQGTTVYYQSEILGFLMGISLSKYAKLFLSILKEFRVDLYRHLHL